MKLNLICPTCIGKGIKTTKSVTVMENPNDYFVYKVLFPCGHESTHRFLDPAYEILLVQAFELYEKKAWNASIVFFRLFYDNFIEHMSLVLFWYDYLSNYNSKTPFVHGSINIIKKFKDDYDNKVKNYPKRKGINHHFMYFNDIYKKVFKEEYSTSNYNKDIRNYIVHHGYIYDETAATKYCEKKYSDIKNLIYKFNQLDFNGYSDLSSDTDYSIYSYSINSNKLAFSTKSSNKDYSNKSFNSEITGIMDNRLIENNDFNNFLLSYRIYLSPNFFN